MKLFFNSHLNTKDWCHNSPVIFHWPTHIHITLFRCWKQVTYLVLVFINTAEFFLLQIKIYCLKNCPGDKYFKCLPEAP